MTIAESGSLGSLQDGDWIIVAGAITTIREVRTRNGEILGFAEMDDAVLPLVARRGRLRALQECELRQRSCRIYGRVDHHDGRSQIAVVEVEAF
jgi:hypothetical protein